MITVDNVGTQDVTGIRVRDTLPAGTASSRSLPMRRTGSPAPMMARRPAAVVECIGGHLLGTESEFYDPAGPAPAGRAMTSPPSRSSSSLAADRRRRCITRCASIRSTRSPSTTSSTTSRRRTRPSPTAARPSAPSTSFSIEKKQTSPVDGAGTAVPVATNGTLKYSLTVTNDATDPAVNIHRTRCAASGRPLHRGCRHGPGPRCLQLQLRRRQHRLRRAARWTGPLTCWGPPSARRGRSRSPSLRRTRRATIQTSRSSIRTTPIPEGNEFNNNATIVTQGAHDRQRWPERLQRADHRQDAEVPCGLRRHEQCGDLRDRRRRTRAPIPPSTWR